MAVELASTNKNTLSLPVRASQPLANSLIHYVLSPADVEIFPSKMHSASYSSITDPALFHREPAKSWWCAEPIAAESTRRRQVTNAHGVRKSVAHISSTQMCTRRTRLFVIVRHLSASDDGRLSNSQSSNFICNRLRAKYTHTHTQPRGRHPLMLRKSRLYLQKRALSNQNKFTILWKSCNF